MKIALATLGFVLALTLSAAAQQGSCMLGPGPDQRPLSFEQWYAQCRVQVQQTCDAMRRITPFTDCNQIANAEYQQYVIAVQTGPR
jgi:hypothetical protein